MVPNPELSFGAMVMGTIVLLIVAFVIREFLLWFFKINEVLAVLREISAKLPGDAPLKKATTLSRMREAVNRFRSRSPT